MNILIGVVQGFRIWLCPTTIEMSHFARTGCILFPQYTLFYTMDTSLIWEIFYGQTPVNFRYLMESHCAGQHLALSEQSIFRGLQILLTTAPVFRGRLSKICEQLYGQICGQD